MRIKATIRYGSGLILSLLIIGGLAANLGDFSTLSARGAVSAQDVVPATAARLGSDWSETSVSPVSSNSGSRLESEGQSATGSHPPSTALPWTQNLAQNNADKCEFLTHGLCPNLLNPLAEERGVSSAAAMTRYVAPGANCGGASPCYGSLQSAVDDSGEGDIIKVAAGTYTGVSAKPAPDTYWWPPPSGIITQHVLITKTIDIRGGYTTSFTDPPDPKSNPTILDAQGLGRVIYIGGEISPTIAGFDIMGGNASGLGGDYGDNGGGIYVERATARIEDAHIYANSAENGGGLALSESSSIISGNVIVNNSAWGWGGGLFLMNNMAEPVLVANRISHNSATDNAQGGGLYLLYGDAVLTNNVITDNHTDVLEGFGGALVLQFASARMLHTTIARNSSNHEYDGIVIAGDSIGGFGTIYMTNTVAISQTTGIVVGYGNTAHVDGILWFSNGTNYTNFGNITVTNEYTSDPLFSADGYHLTVDSAAVDRGAEAGVTTDIDGEMRDDQPDLGADEFPSNAFCDNVNQVPRIECEALIALYNSTNGSTWWENSGWLRTTTPCSWYGVTCNQNQVTEINLQANRLTGVIPPELRDLSQLEVLWLLQNELTGPIPPELSNLSHLQWLLLGTNQLTGPIPPELGSLSQLEVLWLGENSLSGPIPFEVSNLSQLNTLGLQWNHELSGPIPSWLGNLSEMVWLYLQGNAFSGPIPSELGNLSQLRDLSLAHNQLTGQIPAELGDLSQLDQRLWLSNNQLSGPIPPELGNLGSLPNLELNSNPLTGALPSTLVNVPLTRFHFQDTQLCEPPDSTFQAWLFSIADLNSTGILCDSTDLSISHIEVTQGIQDVGNNVSLIAGKPTLVRVYLDCGADCTSIPDVTGELEVVSPNGQEVVSPTPDTVTVRNRLSWESQRPYPWTTLNFFLPLDLIEGEVTMNLTVRGVSETLTRPFAPSPSFRIGYLPVEYDGVNPDPDRIEVAESFLEHVYPLNSVDYFEIPWALPYLGGHNSDSLKRYLNTVVGWYDLFGWPDPNGEPDQLFGWVPHDTWGLGGSSDPTWANGDGRVAFSSDTETTYPVYQMALAHELGHNLDRHHPCNDPNSDWPHDDYAIQDVGFDFGFYAANSIVDDTTDDFMVGGHCGASVHDYKWTSAHTLERLHEELSSSSSALEPLRSVEIPSGQPVLFVSGRAFADSVAELQTAYQLTTTQAITQSTGTDYCLHLEDSARGALTTDCFDLSFIDVETQDPQPFASFIRILQYDPAAARLVLTQDATELAEQLVSPNTPTVTLASPNGGEVVDGSVNVTWTASDLDGDSLEYAVSYSADGGGSWYHLGIGITENNLLVDTAMLPGSSQVLFKVTASDGINTDSDNSDDTLTVLSNSPRAIISIPHDGAMVPPGQPLLLRGRAQDPEDGLLTDSALSWSSDVDGNLGTGATLFVNLTRGDHVITLTATDGDGKQDVTTIHITVEYTLYLPSVRR